MSEQSVKRCTDCKHYSPPQVFTWGYELSACRHKNNESIVDGHLMYSPHVQRYERLNGCGEDGKWWEQK